jgi:hypothetical protein
MSSSRYKIAQGQDLAVAMRKNKEGLHRRNPSCRLKANLITMIF